MTPGALVGGAKAGAKGIPLRGTRESAVRKRALRLQIMRWGYLDLGMSCAELADAFDLTPSRVAKILRTAGIKLRHTGRPRALPFPRHPECVASQCGLVDCRSRGPCYVTRAHGIL